jgi:hypothetical protein
MDSQPSCTTRGPFQKLMSSKEREHLKVGVDGKNWSSLPKPPHNCSDRIMPAWFCVLRLQSGSPHLISKQWVRIC